MPILVKITVNEVALARFVEVPLIVPIFVIVCVMAAVLSVTKPQKKSLNARLA